MVEQIILFSLLGSIFLEYAVGIAYAIYSYRKYHYYKLILVAAFLLIWAPMFIMPVVYYAEKSARDVDGDRFPERSKLKIKFGWAIVIFSFIMIWLGELIYRKSMPLFDMQSELAVATACFATTLLSVIAIWFNNKMDRLP